MTNQNILIVEDELGVAQALKRALELGPTRLYQVEVCSSAEEALERLTAKPFMLLVTDFRLPGMDGLSLLDAARLKQPGLLSVLITAYGSRELEEQVISKASAYVPKPFHLRDIIKVIQGLLAQANTQRVETPAPQAAAAEQPGEQIVTPDVERRRHTYIKVLATDYDGTLARDGYVPPETWDLLRQARKAGFLLILVTGRVLDTFINEGPFSELFEVIVAEDGAVIYFPKKNTVRQPFGRLSPVITQRLEALHVPLERGLSIVATRVPYDETIMNVLQDLNMGATVEYNNGAVMLLPPGATKGTGLTHALQELGYSPHNVIACGDAENDISLLRVAELAVAVPNALPKLKALADVVLPQDPQDRGTGINQLLRQLLSRRGPDHLQRPDRRLVLGYTRDGAPIHLDPVNLIDSRIGIFGDSHSGKSWLSGLLVEELMRVGYQVLVIDPEGDYAGLAASGRCLHLGAGQAPLPSIPDLVNLVEWHAINMFLDLSTRSPEDRQAYITALMRALRGIRLRRGRPHWILLDEAQYFCPAEGGELTDLLVEGLHEGLSIGLVSYRPSQLSPALVSILDDCLLTRLSSPEEVDALAPFLTHTPENQYLLSQIATLPVGQAYLVSNFFRPLAEDLNSPIRFQVGPRAVPHIRHLQKYLRAPLPAHKRFYFSAPDGRSLGATAASLWEFRETLGAIPVDSLVYHQGRGDFEQWILNVLGDGELARQVHKLDAPHMPNETFRQQLTELIIRRYDELEHLM